jgi:Zn-dependent protease with chaperone function
MDFFEAQARARRRTGPLVALFLLGVLGTVAGLYLAWIAGTGLLGLRSNAHGGGLEAHPEAIIGNLSRIDWWQPGALGTISWLFLPMVAISCFFKWWSLRAGGGAVAEDLGGVAIDPATRDLRERTLYNVVEEMSLASGLPVPSIFLLPGEPGINAFAAGYSQNDAAIAVTRGCLRSLNRDELQGVVAHEFSHILNGDMRLNTRLVSLLYGILSLVILGRGLMRAGIELAWHGSNGKNAALVGIPFLLVGSTIYLIGGFGFLSGRLIQAAVSRQREHLADASAVQFTRNPAGLADALKRIVACEHGGRLFAPAASEVSHFCFAQNFGGALANLFATHPRLEARIRLLDPSWDGRPPPPLATPTRPPASGTRDHRGALLRPAASALADPASPVPPPLAPGLSAADILDRAAEISSAAVAAEREFLAALPDPIRDAAHDPARVAELCFALCLQRIGRARPRPDPLLEIIGGRHDPATAHRADSLRAALAEVPHDHHLSLLHLAAPALRQLDKSAATRLLDTLDALIRAEGKISVREFALRRIVSRTLAPADRPRKAPHLLAPAQVASELSLALSAAARIEATNDAAAREAFARAAVEFNGLQPPLAYRAESASAWDALDEALGRLARTPALFRRRVLFAFATALTADARLSADEADLLRAFAAALDCPLPPLLPVSTA